MDETYTQEYETFELSHWWFTVRRVIIEQCLDQYIVNGAVKDLRWLDLGCGTGVLLHSYTGIRNKVGAEMHAGSAARAQAKGLDVRQIGARWDFSGWGNFDLVTLADVLEHVEDDREAVRRVHGVLGPAGAILVTVPALKSLWSDHDEINHHFRRYGKRQLLSLFPPAEWEVLKASYFSSFLLPLIWLTRKIRNLRAGKTGPQAKSDLKFRPAWQDSILRSVFRMEARWLRCCTLPLGSSLLVMARKRG